MARSITPWHVALMLVLGCLAVSCSKPAPEPSSKPGIEIVFESGEVPLVFEPETLHLGRVVPGGIVEGEARVRNAGDRPVQVVNLNAPCECTSAEPDLPRTLAPGQAFSFPVRLNLGRLPRGGLSLEDLDGPEEVRRSLTLWVADGRAAELPVVAELSERLLVDPVVTDFRGIERGSTQTATLFLGPGRDPASPPVEILSVEPSPGPVPIRFEERPAAGGVELDLIAGPYPDLGLVRSDIRVRTGSEAEPVRVVLMAKVGEPLEVVPDQIRVTNADPTRPVVVKVHVRRRDGKPLQLRGASTEHGRIKLAELGESPNGAQVVRVLVAVPPWPDEVRGEITLTTNFPGEAGTVRLPVQVQARRPR